MQNDLGPRPLALQGRHSADVIHVRVRQRNRLKLQPQPLQSLHDLARLLARIDADGAPRLLAAQDARVLLERRDCDLLDDHGLRNSGGSCKIEFERAVDF